MVGCLKTFIQDAGARVRLSHFLRLRKEPALAVLPKPHGKKTLTIMMVMIKRLSCLISHTEENFLLRYQSRPSKEYQNGVHILEKDNLVYLTSLLMNLAWDYLC
jgi:hypothetical protein